MFKSKKLEEYHLFKWYKISYLFNFRNLSFFCSINSLWVFVSLNNSWCCSYSFPDQFFHLHSLLCLFDCSIRFINIVFSPMTNWLLMQYKLYVYDKNFEFFLLRVSLCLFCLWFFNIFFDNTFHLVMILEIGCFDTSLLKCPFLLTQ
jgi:hypothetical protein